MPGQEDLVRTMVWRTVQEIKGLDSAKDFELIALLMRGAVAQGYGFDNLEQFLGAHRIGCFGIFRGRQHYARVCRVGMRHSFYSGIMAQTTGQFEGIWIFALDSDGTILTSRDKKGVELFAGLEGPELIRAVVKSALTEQNVAQPRSRWRRPRR